MVSQLRPDPARCTPPRAPLVGKLLEVCPTRPAFGGLLDPVDRPVAHDVLARRGRIVPELRHSDAQADGLAWHRRRWIYFDAWLVAGGRLQLGQQVCRADALLNLGQKVARTRHRLVLPRLE